MGWFTPAKKAGFRVILSDDDPPLWDRKIRARPGASASTKRLSAQIDAGEEIVGMLRGAVTSGASRFREVPT